MDDSKDEEQQNSSNPNAPNTLTLENTTTPKTSKSNKKTFQRIGLTIAALLTGWHIFASFLWISPPSELRKLVPGNLLSSYMIPWYGQSWSVFAPEPINGDYKLEVRATLETTEITETGEPKTIETDWIDATKAELSMSEYNLFPPRAADLSTQQASKFKKAWDDLNKEQQEITALGFYKGDDWLARMQNELNVHGEDKVVNYVVQERYTVAYATQVAYAVWGEEKVVYVQFRVSRQNIIPFADRHDPDAERPNPTVLNTGWRGTIEMPGQSNKAFEKTFSKVAVKGMQG